MTKISVLYEEPQGLDDICLVPMKMIVRFPRGKIKWDKSAVYLPIKAPFMRHYDSDFHDGIISVSIIFDELLMNLSRPDHFGISLTQLMRRLEIMQERENFTFDYDEVEQFIIQMDDIEELLCMDVRPVYEWR